MSERDAASEPGGEGGARQLPMGQRCTTFDTDQYALVTDDREDDRTLLVAILSREGFRCLEAGDAGRAFELSRTHSLCLGVFEIGLPGMSGAELAWRIRQRMPGVPLVAVSGQLALWDRDDLVDLGFDRLFPKPLDREEFARFCREIRGEGDEYSECGPIHAPTEELTAGDGPNTMPRGEPPPGEAPSQVFGGMR